VTHRRGISERDAARDLDSSTCRSTVLSSYNLAIESNAPELLSRPLKRIRSAERSRKDSLDVPADLYTHVRTLCSLSLSLSLSLSVYILDQGERQQWQRAPRATLGLGWAREETATVAWPGLAWRRRVTPRHAVLPLFVFRGDPALVVTRARARVCVGARVYIEIRGAQRRLGSRLGSRDGIAR
jgi:hypothetical protein